MPLALRHEFSCCASRQPSWRQHARKLVVARNIVPYPARRGATNAVQGPPSWVQLVLLALTVATLASAANVYMLTKTAAFLDLQMTYVQHSRESSTPSTEP